MKSVASLSAAVAVLSGTTNAFWRMPCHDRIGLERLDPIVDPGTASSHGHTIHGGSNFGMSTTYEDLRASDCTSCQFSDDKSAYWTPSLHFVHDGGMTEIVPQIGGMLSYYLLYGDNLKAFPEGFQMLAGDTRLRNFSGPVPDPPTSSWTADDMTQVSLGQKSLGFNCLNYNKQPEGSRYRHFLPTKEFMDENCANGIRAELMFPSCWNGKDVKSDDNKAHMRYPDMIDGGSCPEGFETRLPTLFYETIWNTFAFKDKAGQFVWSNGDPTGYGYHGDFMSGWNVDTLQSAVSTCTNPSGRVEDCPVFAGSLQTEAEQGVCKIQNVMKALSADNCSGPTDGLCGNVPVQYGPQYANPLKAGAQGGEAVITPILSSVASMPTQSYAPAHSKVVDSYGGGVSVFNVKPPVVPIAKPTPALAEAAVAAPAITPPAKAEDANPDDGIISHTTYTRDGVVYEVAIKEVINIVTVDSKRRRHAHQHRRNIGRN
ncbi:WSC domain-containing protein [Clathrospora elynae]|uniref:WSC domain-containing protein n=1 Tax=Clathrospora elynae TaxID=706981 RepID=A0A6A5S252_9PLEO|nr:WSC domain-containing protein [Clathrospora elynae]